MNNMSKCFSILTILCTTTCLSVAAPREQDAEHILEAAGVKGGLLVHVNCGGGELTAALGAGGAFLVHGLDADENAIAKARGHIRSLNMYGRVSVEHWNAKSLPYADNVVNLIVSEQPLKVREREIMRVLAPGGVAYVKKGKTWKEQVKPWPDDIDEWTHYLHDATGNAVADDSAVGPPRRMQWLAGPAWLRNHHTLASISAVVSAKGRIFYIVDEGPLTSIEAPSEWYLVARDAFNGVLLWRKPLSSWAWHRRKFRSGPVQLPRSLVAEGERVYIPLGIDAPVTALDAATGRKVRTYKEAPHTEEIILSDGVLLVLTGSPVPEQAAVDPTRPEKAPFPNEKSLVAFEADTGKELWRWSQAGSVPVPQTLAADNGRVFFTVGDGVVCLNAKTGKEAWCSSPTAAEKPAPKQPGKNQKTGKKQRANVHRSPAWSVATLVVHDDVVLWSNGKRLEALSVETGKALWECPCKVGFRAPTDVLVTAGLVWLGPDFSAGRDLHDGQVKATNTTTKDLWTVGHHHRCYREKATDRYIITGKRGIEFMDLDSDQHSRNNWIRGLCQYGVMPANGLVYAPSHACGCYMEAKLFGFWALAPQAESRKAKAPKAFQKGPAFSKVGEFQAIGDDDWPMQRRDALRSGSTKMKLPAKLEKLWQASIGGRLSAPVAAAGTVVLASIDDHRVAALDADNGKAKWTFTAGGRVDSAPTIYNGLVLFGSADGYAYCLRLSDGELVWRLRGAPQDSRTVAVGQLESTSPIHGSVLIQNGLAYVAAGRSSYLDDGIVLYALEPATGKIVSKTPIRSDHPTASDQASQKDATEDMNQKIAQNLTDFKTFIEPDKSDGFSMAEGVTNDILVGDGTSVYLRHLRFDEKCVRQPSQSRHLFSTSRLIDDTEAHRSHWVLGTGDFSRIPVAYSWIVYNPDRFGYRLSVPHGTMLSFEEHTVWSIRRTKTDGHTLLAEKNRPFSPEEPSLPDFRQAAKKGQPNPALNWSLELPLNPRAILSAANAIVLAGTCCNVGQGGEAAASSNCDDASLWINSPTDGERTAEYKLPSAPVWDGMAAAGGRLFIATVDGTLLCMGN